MCQALNFGGCFRPTDTPPAQPHPIPCSVRTVRYTDGIGSVPISGRSEQQPPVPTGTGQAMGSYGPRMANRYEYSVVELREGMIGGKMSGDKLEKVLNEHAAQGWQLKALTSVEVKGRVGPGGVEGLLVTFERQVG